MHEHADVVDLQLHINLNDLGNKIATQIVILYKVSIFNNGATFCSLF